MSSTDTSPAAILFDKNLAAISSFNDGTYNRLCVDTRPSAGVQPQQSAWGTAAVTNTISAPLLNAGSPALTVNGSVTPQVFSLGAQSKLVTIFGIRIVLVCSVVTFNGTNLGNGAITKGILIGATIGGATVSPVATIKTNEDFYTLNGGGTLTSSGGVLLSGLVMFNQPLAIGSSDAVTVTIQDQLAVTNFLYGRALAYGVRAA